MEPATAFHINLRSERRHSRHGQHMTWRQEGVKHRFRIGWLCDESDNGMSFFVDNRRRPRAGQELELRLRPVNDPRRYRVVHASRTSGTLVLVGCERLPSQGVVAPPSSPDPYDHSAVRNENRGEPVTASQTRTSSPPDQYQAGYPEPPASNGSQRGEIEYERRFSPRWPCQTTMVWRRSPERRIRGGCIVERSLDGMVIHINASDRVAVGSTIKPIDHTAATRHGFHTAIVRRVDPASNGMRLVVELVN